MQSAAWRSILCGMDEQHTSEHDSQPTLDWLWLTQIGAVIVLALIAGALLLDRFTAGDAEREPLALAGRVVYLAPADAAAPNLVVADLAAGTVAQITQTAHGVQDYAVGPGGAQIAFTHNNADGTADIWLVDVAQRVARPLTDCVNARCTQPAWNPDETSVLFQREELFAAGQDRSAPRTWIVDVRTLDTRLLFDDPQVVGGDPLWSPDGTHVAVYDMRAGGIRVTDLGTDDDTLLGSLSDVSGAFSPDGSRLVFPVLVRGLIGQSFYTHLHIADVTTGDRTRASGPEDTPVEDAFAAWSPDGARLVVARRYLDDRYTAGKQIYALDVTTGAVQPLVVDAQYTHAAPQWDAAGRRIIYQRFDLLTPGAQPEIWVYDTMSGDAALVATNAFFPAWLP